MGLPERSSSVMLEAFRMKASRPAVVAEEYSRRAEPPIFQRVHADH
jgi:hypothetical protein